MPTRVRFRPEARSEIKEARRWYEGQVRGLGRAFLSELEAAIDLLSLFPRMHPTVLEDTQVRRVLLRRFPYALVYEIL